MLSVEGILCLLHKCRKGRDLAHVLRLHAHMHQNGLAAHASLGNLLILVLVDFGIMHLAQKVFDSLIYENECSWNSLITGYVKHGAADCALALYQEIQEDRSLQLSEQSFVALLKACTVVKDLEVGCKLHIEVARNGLLQRNIFVGSTLVHMYAKCGLLTKAETVFHGLALRDVVLWNALIGGYAQHGLEENAILCLKQMEHEGLSPDAVTLVSTLTACCSIGDIVNGQEIHSEITQRGLEREPLVGNTLIDTYVKCGSLASAQDVFDKLADRDVVSWTAIIAGYVEHEHEEGAVKHFEQMQCEGICPNAFTYICILKSCGNVGTLDKVADLHGEIVRRGLERELPVANTLLDVYAKCGSLAAAQQVFNRLPAHSVVSWTALIVGYVEHAHGVEALECFKQMQEEGIPGDAVTLVSGLKACGMARSMCKGRELHAELTKKGFEREILAGNVLVDLYGKCGLLEEAQNLFDKLSVHGVISWTALITEYVESGHPEEALFYFEWMQNEGISADKVTLICGLKACGSMEATDKGCRLHTEVVEKGLESETSVGNIMVDMYAKCGLLAEAQAVFHKLLDQDVISWNALITGYAQVGKSEHAFNMFDRMSGQGMKPNLITFVGVLNACGHVGLVDKRKMILKVMSCEYGLIPTLEHYTRMADLLARAGLIDKAVALIENIALHPDTSIWLTVLGACRKWGDVQLGKYVFHHAVESNEDNATTYVCMSNIYVDFST